MTETSKIILIVDDTPENITALTAIISKFGKIKAATGGEKALKICSGEIKPDLIFLDIAMPGMDGWEVFGRLRRDAATAAIPVIFVTALGNDADREKALSLGAAGFVTKPLDAELITGLVGSLI